MENSAYIKKILVSHRVHRDTETNSAIIRGIRNKEDRDMFSKIWILNKFRL